MSIEYGVLAEELNHSAQPRKWPLSLRQWTAIASSMMLHNATPQQISPLLKKYYQQLLLKFERFEKGIDAAPAALSSCVTQPTPEEKAAAKGASAVGSAAGSLMSRRVEVMALKQTGDERSNAGCEHVIVYEPPIPGEEVCELCGSGDDIATLLLCDKCNCGFHMRCLNP